MESTIIDPKNGFPHWEPKCPIDLAVAYEDTATRNRALQLYEHLCDQLFDEYDLQCTWWKLDYLQSPVLFEQAVEAATAATMVIVALKTGLTLPATALRWLESWLPHKEAKQSALVALVGSSGASASNALCPVQLQLQNFARRAGMDFFFHTGDSPGLQDPYSRETITRRAQTVTPLLEEILHQPARLGASPKWFLR